MKIRLLNVVRGLGFLLGGLVAVLASLALLMWIGFDADRTAADLARHFKDRHQRTLIVGHTPQLRLWPRPTLILREASLSESRRKDVFASIGELHCELAPLALLMRRLEIRSISVTGLQLRIHRARSGDWNFAGLLAAAPASTPAPPWQLQLDSLSLREAQVRLDDRRQAMQMDLRNLTLDASALSSPKSGRVSWSGQWLDEDRAENFNFSGKTRVTVSDDFMAGTLEGLALRLAGNGGGLQGADARFEAKRLGWGEGGKQAHAEDVEIQLQGANGPQSVRLAGSAPRLAWQSGQVEGATLELRLTLREADVQSDFNLNLPRLAKAEGGFTGEALTLAWKQKIGSTRGSDGKLSARLEVDLRKPSVRLQALQGELALRHPRLRDGTARGSLSGQIDWEAARGTALNLKSSFGDDALQLQGSLQQVWPAQGSFELTSPRFDADRLLAEASGLPQAPLQIPALGAHVLSGRVQLAGLRLGGLQVDKLDGPLQFDKGVLTSNGFIATLYGGQISGDVSADSTNGQLRLQGEFRDLILEHIAAEGDFPVPLAGRMTGSYRLATVLAADQPALSRLGGAVRWSLTQGAIRGVDISRSLRELRPAILAGTQSARSPGEAENTSLGQVSSRFVFDAGTFQAESVQSRNAWLSLAGSGSGNLQDGTMDFRLNASLLPGVAMMDARDLGVLRGKPLPLRLKGPLLRPDVRYEPAAPKPPGSLR